MENVERSERQQGRAGSATARGLPFTQQLTTEEVLLQKGMTLGREDRLQAMRTVGLFGDKSAPPEE